MARRRSPARWMAPLALLGSIAAVLIVLQASSGESSNGDAPTTTASSGSGTTATQTVTTTKGRRFYRIQPGDTLSSIADATGVPLEQIEALNPDLDAQSLVAGQRIDLRP